MFQTRWLSFYNWGENSFQVWKRCRTIPTDYIKRCCLPPPPSICELKRKQGGANRRIAAGFWLYWRISIIYVCSWPAKRFNFSPASRDPGVTAKLPFIILISRVKSASGKCNGMPPTLHTTLDKQAATRLILARERGHLVAILPRKILLWGERERGNLWPLLTAATRYPRLTFFLVLFFFFFFLLSSLFQQALVLAVLRNLGKRTGKMGGGRREERSLASLIYRVLQDLWLNIIFLGSKKGEGRRNSRHTYFSSRGNEGINKGWNFSWKFCLNEFNA